MTRDEMSRWEFGDNIWVVQNRASESRFPYAARSEDNQTWGVMLEGV
jgi:hypothetical protein